MNTKTYSAHEVRNNLGEMLNQVYYHGIEIIIEKMKKPVAKIVPIKKEDQKRAKFEFNPPVFHMGGIKSFGRAEIYDDYLSKKFKS